MKTIALLTVLFGVYTTAHAFTQQNSPQQMQYVTQNNSAADSKDDEAVGEGSGDDVDTANEADPKNDKDPESDKAPPKSN